MDLERSAEGVVPQDMSRKHRQSGKRESVDKAAAPERSGALNFACVANDVKDYPTWIILGRRHTGVVPLDELARLSSFEWSPDTTRKQ